MLKKMAAISLTAAVLVLTAPAVATAAPSAPPESDSYAGAPRAGISDPVIGICEASTVVFGTAYFQPSETVAVSVSGLNAESAGISGNTAAGDGSMVVSFTPPSNGEGSYALAFSGSRSYTATIVVSHGRDAATSCDHDPGVAAAVAQSASGPALAATGGDVSPWLLGGGALALLAGGTLVGVSASRRSRRS
ncbi:hypothetical protein CW368_04250 [Actinomycetales bacterium SN12]|nr:hypothetical protein CW368_04250 [Actinomycetales bacterium SN12]